MSARVEKGEVVKHPHRGPSRNIYKSLARVGNSVKSTIQNTRETLFHHIVIALLVGRVEIPELGGLRPLKLSCTSDGAQWSLGCVGRSTCRNPSKHMSHRTGSRRFVVMAT